MNQTQTDRIVRFLRANPGSTILELTMGLDPFVANPRARISDARAEGHLIQCRTRSDHRKGYWLIEAGQRTLFGLTA